MNKAAEKPIVLVVDDLPDNITLLSSILSSTYRVLAANSGETALLLAVKNPPDIILLDIMMPGYDGYEVCRRLKADPRTRNIPVIFITALGEVDDERLGFELGAVDYITKPVSPPIVMARVKTQLALYNQNRILEEKVSQRTEEVAKSRLEIIRRLGLAAEYRDNETGMHVIRMSYFARLIARKIGLDTSEADIILNAAPMHDVGKIGISDSILMKPARLTDEERLVMQKHCEFGAEIIGNHNDRLLNTARIAALTHHEKWDGTGYPVGLSGEDIPLVGRILSIADVFDALTSERPYKKAWSIDDAFNHLQKESGKHFDPQLIKAFLASREEILEIIQTHADIVSSSRENNGEPG